ncbi:MAG: hypothetical protein N3D76_08130 [Geminocystis sp.]|nr:hypothetical protein [Geminocystis sp.]HIK38845.1 hypothetical protein [Geminocystis sp. M7585_C2015_104]
MGIWGNSKKNASINEIHKENLKKNLEHRLAVARSRGDQKLIEQLEREAAYLNLKF